MALATAAGSLDATSLSKLFITRWDKEGLLIYTPVAITQTVGLWEEAVTLTDVISEDTGRLSDSNPFSS